MFHRLTYSVFSAEKPLAVCHIGNFMVCTETICANIWHGSNKKKEQDNKHTKRMRLMPKYIYFIYFNKACNKIQGLFFWFFNPKHRRVYIFLVVGKHSPDDVNKAALHTF